MSTPSAIHTLLTDSRIISLKNPSPNKDFFARDTYLPGFGLRISPKGVKSYFVEATIGGHFKRRVIGRHPFETLTEARRKALEALQVIRWGIEPAAILNAPNPTLEGLFSTFVQDKKAVLRGDTIDDYSRVLEGPYFEEWHNLPVQAISRRQVLGCYQRICDENGVGMANKAMRILSSVLNFGKATIPKLENWGNPVTVLGDTRSRRPLKARTRHIPLEALPRWLAALDAYVEGARYEEERLRFDDVRLLLKLLLMTGLRSNEARSLRWTDIDLQNKSLTIRDYIAKNGREVCLPLNAWLAEQLTNRPRSGSEFAFPSSAGGYIRNLNRPLATIAKLSGLPITPHDLRRTFATYLDGVGAPFGVIKQLLNHVSSSDITARYIQHRGMTDLRVYSERILDVVTSGEVKRGSA